MANLTRKDLKEVFTETLEPFARAVQTDFKKIHERMDKLDGRMDKLDGRMDKLDGRMDKLERDVHEVFIKLDELIALFKRHDEQINVLQAHVRRLEERIVKIENEK